MGVASDADSIVLEDLIDDVIVDPLPYDAGQPDSVVYEPHTGEWSSDFQGSSEEIRETQADDSLGFHLIDAGEPSAGIPQRIGEYVIERMIGSGGMGRVYLAKHQTMQRVVAIKTLPPQQMAQASAVDRFYEEVRAAARLLHPNIVTAFDAGNSNGIHFLAMEYVDGDTLTNLVAKHGPMSIPDAIAAIRGAARGLAHAHAASIVHRDVKPGNLMRSIDGTVKVVDLGLASIASHAPINPSSSAASKDSGKLIGTIAFMSPEQLENPNLVDARSDIYSLGATLYFLLTGRPPYEGGFLEQIRGHRHEPLPELFASRPDVDLRLEHVFRRMMAKRPQERYASLLEVLADLEFYKTTDIHPAWVNRISTSNVAGDAPTHRGESTGGELTKVMGIDLGMFYATCAMADPAGNVEVLVPNEDGRTQQRLAIADGPPIIFGEAAAARRENYPGSVLHCIPLYIGQSKVDHLINGRKCPAEVLLAMQIRQLMESCWKERSSPHAVAITVPSSYDQFHRQAVLQAANIAGIRSVRLIDRSLAVMQSWRHDQSILNPPLNAVRSHTAANPEQPQVIVSITGQATEVVVTRYRGSRLQQLGAAGQWHYGTLQWQQMLVDLVAATCVNQFQFDPRHHLLTASSLQVACERALPKFLLLESVNISFQRGGRTVALPVSRTAWLEACEPFVLELLQMIDFALESANINPKRVSQVLLLGIITRIGANRSRIAKRFGETTEIALVERMDVAKGAAICLAGELPGRGNIPSPPQAATTHDFGLLVVDSKNRRRIRPIIPRGTAIPARTNRRIAAGNSSPQILSVVESSTWNETSWRSLGNHQISTAEPTEALELTFEVDVDGIQIIRRRDPHSGGFIRLPALPQPTLTEEEVLQWSQWIQEWMPAKKRSGTS